jgi:cell division septum initiation protein DivIVA
MTQMADALNNAIKQVADFAKQKSSIEDYKQIFASVAQAAKSFGDAIKPILQIFTDVAAVGAPLLAQLADHFKTAAQHAAEFVSQARQSGQLKQWIQQGIDAVKELWGAFKDVVAIIKDLATAQGFGPNFLQALKDVTGAIRWIIENVPGATTIIQAFFDAWLVAKVIQGLANMVKSITDVIGMLKKFVTANEEAAAASEAAAGRASTAWATVGKAIGLAGLALGADALLPQNTPEQTKHGQEHPVTGFFDSQRDELHGIAEGIKDPMKALEDLKQELAAFPGQAASSPIVQFFSQLPTQIATEIGKVREALTRNASNMWQGFTQALNTGWTSVTSFFSGIGAKITAAVGNATQWLGAESAGCVDRVHDCVEHCVDDRDDVVLAARHEDLDRRRERHPVACSEGP